VIVSSSFLKKFEKKNVSGACFVKGHYKINIRANRPKGSLFRGGFFLNAKGNFNTAKSDDFQGVIPTI